VADEKSIMERIREANKAYTTGLGDEGIEHWATIYLMGKGYTVPAHLTIMQAIEYAGYQLIRGSGCRAGFCGACATVYRKTGDYKLHAVLACQTRVEDGMYLAQIPFTPAEKANYNIDEENPDAQVLLKYYPELARCVSCNTCTKACPQELQVMDYVQAALRGDLQRTAELSFDCIQCGLCTLRCPAEISQYHVGQLARRMYGKYGLSEPPCLAQRVQEIEQGRYEEEFNLLIKMDRDELEKLYVEREME
jgi:succinate dehydrogenase/fumarate reductase-like Fe-S protein